jgi:hypothetical protein
MVTYSTLSTQAGPFVAMTGLTLAEFRGLLLSQTYPGAANDKRAADEERLRYPPGFCRCERCGG